MAYYVMEGYTTPYGVDTRQQVKEYQEKLGVAADGIWGPKTQAAYEKNAGGYIWAKPSSVENADSYANEYDTSAFDSFYKTIFSYMSVPKIDYVAPSADDIAANIQAAVYPSVIKAKEERKAQGETNKAEIDADAYARGMGGSTYISEMKADENKDVADDISGIEMDYQAMLADKLSTALEHYANMEAEAEYKSASMQQSAVNSAMSYASQWYLNYLKSQENASYDKGSSAKSTSKSAKSTKAENNGDKKKSGLSEQDYENYVKGLSYAERSKLFNSSENYWAVRRNELLIELGSTAYAALKKKYGVKAGGGGLWKREKY